MHHTKVQVTAEMDLSDLRAVLSALIVLASM